MTNWWVIYAELYLGGCNLWSDCPSVLISRALLQQGRNLPPVCHSSREISCLAGLRFLAPNDKSKTSAGRFLASCSTYPKRARIDRNNGLAHSSCLFISVNFSVSSLDCAKRCIFAFDIPFDLTEDMNEPIICGTRGYGGPSFYYLIHKI